MKQKSANKKIVSNQSSDIVSLILDDHKALKKLIKIMKDLKKPSAARLSAFDEFISLLIGHSHPEEQVLYAYMKKEDDFRSDSFEGEIEHVLADQLLEEAIHTDDENLWTARVKVLAELVEQHIDEEEKRLLPRFKKYTDSSIRKELGMSFYTAKKKIIQNENASTTESQAEQMTTPH